MRGIWIFLGFMVMGIGPIAMFAWFNQLGDFAKSPQTVEMNLGTTSFVAGGRAKLWFAMVEDGPVVEVACKSESRMVSLPDEERSDEVCGIQVRKIDLLEKERRGHRTLRVVLQVTWQDLK